MDLKVKNETNHTFQIQIDFDEKYMYGKLLTNNLNFNIYEIRNRNLSYTKINGETFEKVDIYRNVYNKNKKLLDSVFIYKNICKIGYELEEITPLEKVAL